MDVAFGYLDGVVIWGDDGAVLQAVRVLESRAQQIELHLNMSKCMAAPTATGSHTCDLASFDARVKRKTSGCFEFLGAPIGDKMFREAWLCEQCVDRLKNLLRAVPVVEGAQIAHKLLHRC